MKWELLTKKGYEITNKRVLGNPSYTSEETRNKDLIQELALVQEWLFDNFDVDISINGKLPFIYYEENDGELKWHFEYRIIKNKDGQKCEVIEPKDWFDSKTEALISAIEYTILNKLLQL